MKCSMELTDYSLKHHSGLKEKTCQNEMQWNDSHMLLNYEEALQNDQSLCEELFFLPSALHYYDNMFISAVVARAVFSTEKLLQN